MPVLVRLPLSRKTLCVQCDGHSVPVEEIRREVSRHEGIPGELLALSCGGVRLREAWATDGQWLTCAVTGLPGGKGGFGSMLRAIGAQIEKTTNREACRDLSGRRLRDINHEARLKRWVAKQAERENQHKQRKEYCEPEHHLEDPDYERTREQIPERIQDAVAQDDGSDSAHEDRDTSAKTDSSSERDTSTAEATAMEAEPSGDGEDSHQRKPDDTKGAECSTTTTETSHTEKPQPPDTDK
ncbi:hypothetical protein HPB51_012232 [Rhipicephalus microplus]|uniref:SDE2-like domain-containing protein n=1 Tax=Rhipicephalus microplus TaxID=6941 RepID=A0A9J6E9D0_RHIMP|nr:hypothetical protein HPB51_012232 [Rhipicephalus microplus]